MGPKARRENQREEEEKEEDNKKREAALAGAGHKEQKRAAHEARRVDSRRHEEEDREDKAEAKEQQHQQARDIAREDSKVTTRGEAHEQARANAIGRAGSAGGDDQAQQDDDEDAYEDVDEVEQPATASRRGSGSHLPATPRSHRQNSNKPSTIFIHSRPVGRRRESVRQQVFGGAHPGGAEVKGGRQSRSGSIADPNHLAPPGSGRRGRPILNDTSREGSAVGSISSAKSRSNLSNANTNFAPRSRDVSPASRSRGLRFAEGTAESSETAPGPSFYKRPANHNPDLAITRTASVQSNGGGAGEETPKGQTYYNNRPSGSSGLQMYKSRSIQSGLGGDRSDGEEESGKGGFLSRLKRRGN